MSLSFLYPLCWFGAIALAAPIWLHLRRRSEQRVISFSALRFLD
ncbi:MAG: BatA domain-containing protein, partial [Planctomycetota bacterium]